MTKTKEQLILDFKKANSQRKERIAAKAGFKSASEYLASLQEKKKTSTKKEKLDYVVAFDTTGSMGSYIADVKEHVQKLIPEMFSQDIDLQMRIIAFGDYCDMENISQNKFGKAYQESEFTNNPDELIQFIQGAENTAGGDAEEFYELVIKKIIDETPWRKDARKLVLFIADDRPHKVGYTCTDYRRTGMINNQIDWKEEAKRAATLKISFDTLSIHGDSYPWYRELAQITNGVYLPFQSSTKTSKVMAASAYARGSKKSKATFTVAYASAVATGDDELIGVYKSLNEVL